MEVFDLVDRNNLVIGTASRKECHCNKALLHRAVHIIIVNSAGQVFLQKRAENKDVQPGKWDSSVGGHVDSGEDYFAAGVREAGEELGIDAAGMQYLYEYIMTSDVESEFVRTYLLHCEGGFSLQESEISDGRFWDEQEIRASLGTGVFTPNFEDEFERYMRMKREQQ
ncbi:MAG: NUDIX domain-containing protein [Spirochaetales bacterium]|nr:NUDIX domain-containing protein [Spirochaetales bacterium]